MGCLQSGRHGCFWPEFGPVEQIYPLLVKIDSGHCKKPYISVVLTGVNKPVPTPGGGLRVYFNDEAGVVSAEASTAVCVQRFDDSRNSAIHTTYRISLRSSSLREPRYPLSLPILHTFPACLLYTSPSPRDRTRSRMPSSA